MRDRSQGPRKGPLDVLPALHTAGQHIFESVEVLPAGNDVEIVPDLAQRWTQGMVRNQCIDEMPARVGPPLPAIP